MQIGEIMHNLQKDGDKYGMSKAGTWASKLKKVQITS